MLEIWFTRADDEEQGESLLVSLIAVGFHCLKAPSIGQRSMFETQDYFFLSARSQVFSHLPQLAGGSRFLFGKGVSLSDFWSD